MNSWVETMFAINIFIIYPLVAFIYSLYSFFIIRDKGLYYAYIISALTSYFYYWLLYLPSYIYNYSCYGYLSLKFFKEVVFPKYLPFVLLWLWYWSGKRRKMKIDIISWWVSFFFAVTLLITGIYFVVNGNFFEISKLRWQGASLMTWSSLFLLLIIFSRKRNLKTVLFALFASMFASDLYEIPWLLYDNPDVLITPKFVLSGWVVFNHVFSRRWSGRDVLLLAGGFGLLLFDYYLWFVRPPFFTYYMRLPSLLFVSLLCLDGIKYRRPYIFRWHRSPEGRVHG